jgi:hypothetical protein
VEAYRQEKVIGFRFSDEKQHMMQMQEKLPWQDA